MRVLVRFSLLRTGLVFFRRPWVLGSQVKAVVVAGVHSLLCSIIDRHGRCDSPVASVQLCLFAAFSPWFSRLLPGCGSRYMLVLICTVVDTSR